MDLELKGKRALVTGGSRGLGAACAKILAEEGCEVLIASRNPGPGPNALAVDLTVHGAAERLSDWAGKLDILVNNAGAIPRGDWSMDEATWRQSWELKLFGYINLTRAVYAGMTQRRSGAIVNILGVAGERLDSTYIAGSTANAGLIAYTRTLGGVSHLDNVRVVGVSPGTALTERTTKRLRERAQTELGDAERFRELFGVYSFNRPAHPHEIAAAVAFLASPRSAYTSGAILNIDGGLSSRSVQI